MHNRLVLFLLLSTVAAAPRRARAEGDDPRAYDFLDSYYAANGIRVDHLVNRVTGSDGRSVVDQSPDPETRRDVRAIETLGVYDPMGVHSYASSMSELFVDPGIPGDEPFTADGAGNLARIIANRFSAFFFPKRNPGTFTYPDRFGTSPGNLRQNALFDTTMGYFAENPLGLWRFRHVTFLSTAPAHPLWNTLIQRNGMTSDASPLIKRLSEIRALEAAFIITISARGQSGTNGPPWFV